MQSDCRNNDELAAELRLLLARLARRLKQEAVREPEGITLSRLSALSSIVRHGPLSITELAERERIGHTTATRTIDGLLAEGLVVREVDEATAERAGSTPRPAGAKCCNTCTRTRRRSSPSDSIAWETPNGKTSSARSRRSADCSTKARPEGHTMPSQPPRLGSPVMLRAARTPGRRGSAPARATGTQDGRDLLQERLFAERLLDQRDRLVEDAEPLRATAQATCAQ